MKKRTLKILCTFSFIMMVIGAILALYSETEEKTVSVVPVPKRERVTTFPHLVLGSVVGIMGGVILATSLYCFSKQGEE